MNNKTDHYIHTAKCVYLEPFKKYLFILKHFRKLKQKTHNSGTLVGGPFWSLAVVGIPADNHVKTLKVCLFHVIFIPFLFPERSMPFSFIAAWKL